MHLRREKVDTQKERNCGVNRYTTRKQNLRVRSYITWPTSWPSTSTIVESGGAQDMVYVMLCCESHKIQRERQKLVIKGGTFSINEAAIGAFPLWHYGGAHRLRPPATACDCLRKFSYTSTDGITHIPHSLQPARPPSLRPSKCAMH